MAIPQCTNAPSSYLNRPLSGGSRVVFAQEEAQKALRVSTGALSGRGGGTGTNADLKSRGRATAVRHAQQTRNLCPCMRSVTR
jgi:hypothetical protein